MTRFVDQDDIIPEESPAVPRRGMRTSNTTPQDGEARGMRASNTGPPEAPAPPARSMRASRTLEEQQNPAPSAPPRPSALQGWQGKAFEAAPPPPEEAAGLPRPERRVRVADLPPVLPTPPPAPPSAPPAAPPAPRSRVAPVQAALPEDEEVVRPSRPHRGGNRVVQAPAQGSDGRVRKPYR